ncbi:MAG: hypothetical protein ACNYPE_10950 [Candidatus Azotimanducaceae bacterium WSBS_2022_MAG_OTU7]
MADFILVDGNPAADVTVLGEKSRIKAVYVGGDPYRTQNLYLPDDYFPDGEPHGIPPQY